LAETRDNTSMRDLVDRREARIVRPKRYTLTLEGRSHR